MNGINSLENTVGVVEIWQAGQGAKGARTSIFLASGVRTVGSPQHVRVHKAPETLCLATALRPTISLAATMLQYNWFRQLFHGYFNLQSIKTFKFWKIT